MEAFGFQISRRCRRSLAQNLLLPGLGVGRPAALALELSHRCSSTAAMELRRQAVAEQPEVASFFSRTNAHLLNGFMGTAAAATQQQLSQQAHPGESSSGCLQAAYVDAITNMSRNRGAPYFHSETEGLSLSPLSAMEEVEQSLQETKVSQDDERVRKKWHQQVQNEIRSAEEAYTRYSLMRDEAIHRKDLNVIPRAKSLMSKWHPKLSQAISEQIPLWMLDTFDPRTSKAPTASVKRKAQDPKNPVRYLQMMDPDKLAVITMHSTISELVGKTGHATLAKASMTVGRAVQLQYNLDMLKERERMRTRLSGKMKAAKQSLLNIMDMAGMSSARSLALFQDLESSQRLSRKAKEDYEKMSLRELYLDHHHRQLTGEHVGWPVEAAAKLGTILISCLIKTAEIEVPVERDKRGGKAATTLEPAFKHSIEWNNPNKTQRGQHSSFQRIRKYGMVTAHPEVLKNMMEGINSQDITVSRYFPMVVPPLPWIAYDTGGHLTLRCLVMRTRGDRQQLKLLQQADEEMINGGPGMGQVYEALNALGSVGWRVNNEILEVVEEAWAAGGGVAELPDREALPLIPRPAHRWRLVHEGGQLLCQHAKPTYLEERRWKNENSKIKKTNYERHSLKCDMEYKLAVAREIKDEEVIYFPHNVDFRGRAYPMHPYLSHLSSDVCRGLLMFAESRPLGEKGLEWLFIQAANLYGANKMSLNMRKQFTEEHMEQMRDSAERPLTGKRWWMDADEPWQCLAVCKEICRAIDSGNPASYLSHLPVHQDGSCNGLQHYAALGRDSTGGRAVNLTDMDSPQDVYSGIAELVDEQVKKDAAAGSQEARMLLGNVDRKLVKQTVMTSVYGVTFVGAREQISSRLRERGWDDKDVMLASKYGAKVTMNKLLEMFKSAKHIMLWLNDCAKRVAQTNQPVQWRTPLGLPVLQPYKKNNTKTVSTVLQRLTLQDNTKAADDVKVMKQRQRSAFPPNYIHSIDSTHMMMTAIECRKRGLAFAGVHDSFWTHAGTIETMNQVLREKFLELHSKPLLQMLLVQLQEQYPGVEFDEVPMHGDLKLEEIRRAKYFFS